MADELRALCDAGPRARYALEALLALLGVEWRSPLPGEPADLAYGYGRGRCSIPAGPQHDWDDPRPQLTRRGGLSILHRPGGPADDRGASSGSLGFDALYATYACLTAPWERADPCDEAGCPIAAEGWLATHGLLREPLVHRYAAKLAAALESVGVTTKQSEPAVVLTHDVDNNFRHLFGLRESWALLRDDVRNLRFGALRRAAGLARRASRRRGDDPNDRFEEWLLLPGRHAFFVASYGLFDPGGDRRDVPYDVRHPEVAWTMRRLARAGADVGIHLSLQARQSAEQVRREVERLATVLDAPVWSARHHWWALGARPERTLRFQAAAGIQLDCSFGFNDRAGFRRGIAVPFRLYDRDAEEALPISSLPTTAMDAAVFRAGRSFEESVDDLAELHETVRSVGGALVLDWHAHALNPATLSRAGEGLRKFLETVACGTPLRAPSDLVAPERRR